MLHKHQCWKCKNVWEHEEDSSLSEEALDAAHTCDICGTWTMVVLSNTIKESPMKKKHYTCRWARLGHPSIANVTIMATNDASAIRQADRVAKELGVTNTPRDIYQGGRCVETLSSGVSFK